MSARWRLFGTKKRRRKRYEVREKEKNKSEAWCFGFERRGKETKLSGLCEDEAQGGIHFRRAGKTGARRAPVEAGYFTTWALMRLVEPLRPMGTPAVITTVSPGLTRPSFRAASTDRENRRSVESTLPTRQGWMPQEMAS